MGEDNIHHKKTPKHGAANTAFSLSGAKRALVDNIKDWALVKLGAGGGGGKVFLLKSSLKRPLSTLAAGYQCSPAQLSLWPPHWHIWGWLLPSWTFNLFTELIFQ